MNWLDRLERRYRRFAIPNLINIVLIGQLVAWFIIMFVNSSCCGRCPFPGRSCSTGRSGGWSASSLCPACKLLRSGLCWNCTFTGGWATP